ncbi:MAG: hypothetical protein HUJ53_00705, partial [Holdemanella sp.]|nr:hypothetical protein [Holdemanella sp.]
IYKYMEAFPFHSLNVEHNLAEVYYKRIYKDLDKALYYYTYLIEKSPNCGEYYFYAGTCYRYLKEFDKAEEIFKKEIEVDPTDIDGYRGLSYVYEYKKAYPKLLSLLHTMIDRTEEDKKKAPLYFRVHKILNRLGQWKEAIKALDITYSYDDSYYVYRQKYDVYTSNGQWEACEKHLEDWKNANEDMQEYYAYLIFFNLYTGNVKKAKKLLNKHMNDLSEEAADAILRDIYAYDMNYDALIRLWLKKSKDHRDDSHSLMHLALNHFYSNKKEKAKEYAKMALDLLLDKTKKNKPYEPLYTARCICMYAILGEKEKAMEAYTVSTSMHLCESCIEKGCKDAEIFMVHALYILGDKKEAYERAKKNRSIYPYEFDFVILEKRFGGIL